MLNILFIIEIFLLGLLTFFFVPTSDDLYFRYAENYNQYGNIFVDTLYYGNGRLLGNLFAFIFSRCPQVFYLLEMILIPLCALAFEKVVEVKNSRVLIMALFLLQPLRLFSETVAFMCTFINYALPIIFFVFSLFLLKLSTNLRGIKMCCCFVMIAILGVAEELFNEAASLVFIFAILFLLLEKRNRNAQHIVALVSNIIGCLLMFLYKFYIDYSLTYVGQRPESYRRTLFSCGGIKNWLISICLTNTRFLIVTINIMVVFFTILFILLFKVIRKDLSYAQKKKKLIVASVMYYLSYTIVLFWIHYFGDNFIMGGISDLLFFLSALILLCCMFGYIINIYSLIKAFVLELISKKERLYVYFVLLLIGISFAPFLVVSPCGYRCLFLTMFLIATLFVIIYKYLIVLYEVNLGKSLVALALIVILNTAILSVNYSSHKAVFNYKMAHLDSEVLPKIEDKFIYNQADDDFLDSLSGVDHSYVSLREFKQLKGK